MEYILPKSAERKLLKFAKQKEEFITVPAELCGYNENRMAPLVWMFAQRYKNPDGSVMLYLSDLTQRYMFPYLERERGLMNKFIEAIRILHKKGLIDCDELKIDDIDRWGLRVRVNENACASNSFVIVTHRMFERLCTHSVQSKRENVINVFLYILSHINMNKSKIQAFWESSQKVSKIIRISRPALYSVYNDLLRMNLICTFVGAKPKVSRFNKPVNIYILSGLNAEQRYRDAFKFVHGEEIPTWKKLCVLDICEQEKLKAMREKRKHQSKEEYMREHWDEPFVLEKVFSGMFDEEIVSEEEAERIRAEEKDWTAEQMGDYDDVYEDLYW